MIKWWPAFALLALIAPRPADGGEKKRGFPDTPPPSFAIVVEVNDRAAEISLRFLRLVPVREERKIVRDGVEGIETTNYYQFVPRVEKVLLHRITVFNTKWEKLKPDAALERLRNASTVLVSQDGKRVHPAYLEVLQDDVPVLVLSAPVSQGPKNK